MKNVVSFEAARALTEAGFPQPKLEAGQVWYYNEKGFYCTVLEAVFAGTHKIAVNAAGVIMRVEPDENYFAPTATDILRELPETALLSRIENDFQCRVMSPDFRQRCEYARRDQNPAEACASAYLEINKTRQP